MMHKVKVKVPVKKWGFFGKKTVWETRIIKVDDKTYKEMKKAERNKPYTLEEMICYDDIIYDE